MSVKAVVTNGLSNTYDNRFYVAQYAALPATWADIGKSGTDYTSVASGSMSADFSGSNYLVVAVYPSGSDLTGSAVAYDVKQLLKYASSTPDSNGNNLNLVFCGMSSGSFVVKSGTTTVATLVPGTTSVPAQNVYVSLNSYSLTAITDAATGTFGYTIGDSTGSTTYGMADSTGVIQTFKISRGTVVKIRHSMSMLMWILVLLVILVIVAAVGYGGYMYYKKHKMM